MKINTTSDTVEITVNENKLIYFIWDDGLKRSHGSINGKFVDNKENEWGLDGRKRLNKVDKEIISNLENKLVNEGFTFFE